MSIPKKLRFEVFKRDSFACQYCGRKAPDVVLHCDHVHPESQGGETTLLNLITACSDCNLGKGARELADNSVLEKQREQLAGLQERKEQLEMMMAWQRGLAEIESETVANLAGYWSRLAENVVDVQPKGLVLVKKWAKKYGAQAVLDAMLAASERYIEADALGIPMYESVVAAWEKIPGILALAAADRKEPWLKDLFYIRKIVSNRFDTCVLWQAKEILERAFAAGADAEDLKDVAKQARSWSAWRAEMEEVIDQYGTRF